MISLRIEYSACVQRFGFHIKPSSENDIMSFCTLWFIFSFKMKRKNEKKILGFYYN